MSSDGTSQVQDTGASQQGNVIACAVATWSIAALFACTRFYLRAYLIKVWGPEDWVIFVALVLSALLSAAFIVEAHFGLGKAMSTIPVASLEKLAEVRNCPLFFFVREEKRNVCANHDTTVTDGLVCALVVRFDRLGHQNLHLALVHADLDL